MNKNDLEKNEKKLMLKELLGAEFSDAELDQLVEEYSELSIEAEELARKFREFREVPLPPLAPNFTEKVMTRLSTKSRLRRLWKDWVALPRLVRYGGLLAGVFVIIFSMSSLFRSSIPPGFQVLEQKAQLNQEKTYVVRFAIQSQGAKKILLLGDFNEWQGIVLKKDKDDVFHAELSLNQGTYAYGFMVDGKTWIPDPSSPHQVEDGFGKYNSLVNL